MANYSTLKAAVADVVKTNGTQAITGANLQTVLLSIINSVGGGGYIFKGVATPSTDAGTPDENVFYIGGAGTYANFGTSVTVPVGSICVFKYNGSWTKEQIALFAGIDDVPTMNSNNLVKSGGVHDAINNMVEKGLVWEDGYYILSTGGIYSSSNWQHTQKMDINSVWLSAIDYTGNAAVATIAFFNESGTYISGVANASGVTEVPSIPENAKFFALTKSMASNAKTYCRFSLGDDFYTHADFDIQKLLFSNIDWLSGYYSNTGSLVTPHASFVYSGLIDISMFWIEQMSLYTNPVVSTIAFFDEGKNFISGIVGSQGVITEIPTIPANTKYFAVSRRSTLDYLLKIKANITNFKDVSNLIPALDDYAENLYYDPNFEQGFGIIGNMQPTWILNDGFNIEKQDNRNWLAITSLAKTYNPRIPIFTLAGSEIKVGDKVNVLLDYQFTDDNVGGSFIAVVKNNNGTNVIQSISLNTLDASGTLSFEFVVPSDMTSAELQLQFASSVGSGFSFKISNLRIYSKGRRFIQIHHKLTFDNELTPKKNIFNKADIVEDAYLDINGGTLSNTTIGYSNPIHVDEGSTYHTNVPHTICFYDMYDNYVMGVNATILNENNGNFTVPIGSGITHIRANCYYNNLNTLQIEKGTAATTYEPFILQNEYLEAGGAANINVDDVTIGKTSENVIFVKDGGISEAKLDAAAQAKLNVAPVINEIGDVTITGGNYTYLATDYLNADGNVSGKENTVAEWQAMINSCAATGGTIFFPDGHYVCKPAVNETKYILLQNNVALKGSSTTGCIVELQMSDEGKFFRLAQNATAEISDMTVIHNLLNVFIEPNNNNMGKRVTFIVDYSGVNLTLNNLHIKAVNLNNGYDITTDNFQAASAAYMVLSVANANCRVVANNCYAESPAWGIFNVSTNSDLIWNGDLRCWYKCTGAHGTGSRIIVNGNLTSYGSGSYACISCSGGHTIVNGNLYRIPEVDAQYSLYGSAVYAGGDDEPTIIVNGNIYTCSAVYQGVRGVCEITGNVYCIDKTFTNDINRILFQVGEYNSYFADVRFTGNISCMGVKPFALFDVNKGRLEIAGDSFTSSASRIVSSADGHVKITGSHKVIRDRFIRVYAGTLEMSGIYEYSANHEMIQIVAGAAKKIVISNASFNKPVYDYDRLGNDVTTSSGTGSALLFNHSAESGTKVIVSNVVTNGAFSQNSEFSAEIYNTVASQLGVATKSNTLIEL